jgi:hypothetical protein
MEVAEAAGLETRPANLSRRRPAQAHQFLPDWRTFMGPALAPLTAASGITCRVSPIFN